MKKLFTLLVMSICMVLTANAGEIYLIGSDGTWAPDHASATLPETSTAGVYEAEVTITSAWFAVVKNLANAGDWDALNSADNRFAASNLTVGEECSLDQTGDKSSNLATPGKYKVTVNLYSMTIKLVLVEEIDDKYYVAGVDALGLDWTGKNEDLLMTTTDKTTYTFTKENLTLEKDVEYKYKVVKNGSTWIPDGIDTDIILTVAETGIYTVTFTYKVGDTVPTATATKTGDAEATKHTYTVYGNFEGENSWKDFDMTESPEGTWTAEIKGVAAGEYKFKVRADGAWTISYPSEDSQLTVNEENTTVTIVYVEDPQGITVTQKAVPTSIDRVNAEAENAPAYNLAGVKASKGLVIKNNKKYILR